MAWNNVNASYPWNLRSTFQQTDQGLLWKVPACNLCANNTGALLRRYEVHNRSGGTINVGIGFRLHNSVWKAGYWTEVGSVYADGTSDAQDLPATTADFALETMTDNDGFVILCQHPFDWVSIRVVTAGVGAATHAIRYSNYAGTGWTAYDANSIFVDTITTALWAAGEIKMVWTAPDDWGKVTSIGSIPAGWYALNVRATSHPATSAAVASVMEIGKMLSLEGLVDNGDYAADRSTYSNYAADALVAFFSGTANAGNTVRADVTTI
jgi:hypothetical protein